MDTLYPLGYREERGVHEEVVGGCFLVSANDLGSGRSRYRFVTNDFGAVCLPIGSIYGRMAESTSFFERVWAVVAEIPPGRVTTYGDIAEHLGRRGAARTVGWALNEAVGTDLPCHRVVNRNGELTGRRHFETPHVMKERLESEGVAFVDDHRVDLEAHRWRPGTSSS